MSGPATKMRASIVALLGPKDRETDMEASYLVGTISPEDCESMDAAAAAEEWARQHEEEVSDMMKFIWRDRPADQYIVLLAAALRLVAQERKEAGNG